MSTPWLLGVAAFVAGFAVAPVLISGMSLIEHIVPATRLTESMTWVSGGLSVGLAGGLLLSGYIVDGMSASTAYLVTSGCGVGVFGVAVTGAGVGCGRAYDAAHSCGCRCVSATRSTASVALSAPPPRRSRAARRVTEWPGVRRSPRDPAAHQRRGQHPDRAERGDPDPQGRRRGDPASTQRPGARPGVGQQPPDPEEAGPVGGWREVGAECHHQPGRWRRCRCPSARRRPSGSPALWVNGTQHVADRPAGTSTARRRRARPQRSIARPAG